MAVINATGAVDKANRPHASLKFQTPRAILKPPTEQRGGFTQLALG